MATKKEEEMTICARVFRVVCRLWDWWVLELSPPHIAQNRIYISIGSSCYLTMGPGQASRKMMRSMWLFGYWDLSSVLGLKLGQNRGFPLSVSLDGFMVHDTAYLHPNNLNDLTLH